MKAPEGAKEALFEAVGGTNTRQPAGRRRYDAEPRGGGRVAAHGVSREGKTPEHDEPAGG
jgi:hypothetical protein